MQQCQIKPSLYTSFYKQQSDMTIPTIIILTIVLPLQLICLIGICIYNRYKRQKIFQIQPMDRVNIIENDKNYNRDREYEENRNYYENQQQNGNYYVNNRNNRNNNMRDSYINNLNLSKIRNEQIQNYRNKQRQKQKYRYKQDQFNDKQQSEQYQYKNTKNMKNKYTNRYKNSKIKQNPSNSHIKNPSKYKKQQNKQKQYYKSSQFPKYKSSQLAQQKFPYSLINRIQTSIQKYTNYPLLIFLTLIIILSIIISIILLCISIGATQQALINKYQYAQCILSKNVKQFINGTQNTNNNNISWIGLSNIVPNITKLQLNTNTRIKVTKNSILSLVLNGTNTTYPIGFPNNTAISVLNSSSNYTVINSTSVKSYIQLNLRQWLYRNSSLSSTYQYPICQLSPIYLPHPLNDGQTIQLNYMNSICTNLTYQVNNLVKNGQYIDELLKNIIIIENNKIYINNNLSALNNSYANYAFKNNQYFNYFNSTNIDINGQRAVPIIMVALVGILAIILGIYFIIVYFRITRYTKNDMEIQQQNIRYKQQQQNNINYNKYEKQHINNNNNIHNNNNNINIIIQNISYTNSQNPSPSQIQIKKQQKIKKILKSGMITNSNYTNLLNIFYYIFILIIGLSTISYIYSINKSIYYCKQFNNVLNISNYNLSNIKELSYGEIQLLNPIQKCLNVNKLSSTSTFLQNTQSSIYNLNLKLLQNISTVYNLTTPVSVFNSISLNQIQILKNYLLHMQTMPIKSQDFNILSILKQLNSYTNGTSQNSKQYQQCSSSIVQDQYVYNIIDCLYPLIIYNTQQLIAQPRCLQIPTFNGVSGTNTGALNNVQNTIILNSTCNSMYSFYNGSNGNCFLGQRLGLLYNNGCNITANQYSRRIKNLVNFSITTGSYSNTYLQNLRNYIGVYSVLSTNMTQFFNGANMSGIINQFGILTNNLLNKLSQIYNSYCPNDNTIAMLLYDGYIWIFITFGMLSFSYFLMFGWEICVKIYVRREINKKYGDTIEKQRQNKQKQKQLFRNLQKYRDDKIKMRINQLQPQKSTLKRLQISQATLRNQQIEQENAQYVNKVLWDDLDDQNKYNKYKKQKKGNKFNKKQKQYSNENTSKIKSRNIGISRNVVKQIILPQQKNIGKLEENIQINQIPIKKFSLTKQKPQIFVDPVNTNINEQQQQIIIQQIPKKQQIILQNQAQQTLQKKQEIYEKSQNKKQQNSNQNTQQILPKYKQLDEMNNINQMEINKKKQQLDDNEKYAEQFKTQSIENNIKNIHQQKPTNQLALNSKQQIKQSQLPQNITKEVQIALKTQSQNQKQYTISQQQQKIFDQQQQKQQIQNQFIDSATAKTKKALKLKHIHMQQKQIKNAEAFFGKIANRLIQSNQEEDIIKQKERQKQKLSLVKDKQQMYRKTYSRMEIRNNKDHNNLWQDSLTKVAKQGRQKQRNKVQELDRIIGDTIDNFPIKNIQGYSKDGNKSIK